MHCGAELLEIQINQAGDAARYRSTVKMVVRDNIVTNGRWQEIRYSRDYRFEYMLLDRLRCDCEYYLGYGERCARQLWALDEQKQIDKMRELYDLVPEKPEWLTREQIDAYAAQMGAK